VGEAVDVVVLVLLLEDVPLLGEEPVLIVVFVSVLFSPAGEGLTTVVLVSVFFSAGGLVVSVFCSQAASNAAPARMQMYFFIVVEAQCGLTQESEQAPFSVLGKVSFLASRMPA
jgi:hypothetical protein